MNLRSELRLSALVLAAMSIFHFSPLYGAEFVVVSGSNEGDSNPGDGLCRTPGQFGACSLRAAVEESNALPGTDTIVLGPGSHEVLSPERVLSDHVNIEGVNAAATTLHSNGGNYRLFRVETGVVVSIRDLTLMGFGVSATPDSYGAAIDSEGSLLVTGVWFRENHASQGCGAVRSRGLLEVRASTFSGNGAGFDHGAGALCVVEGGTAAVYNSTFLGNRSYRGGAIEVFGSSSVLILWSSTFVDNVSVVPIGSPTSSVLFLNGGTVDLQRNLIVGDCVYDGGTVTSDGGNLESPGQTCLIGAPGDQPSVPAHTLDLGSLAYWGGTVPTVLLGPDSPAVDAPTSPAVCPIDDARGFPRDASCDSGAFERQPGDAVPIFSDGFETGDTSGWGLL